MQISRGKSRTRHAHPGPISADTGHLARIHAGVRVKITRAGWASATAATAAPTVVFLGANAVGGLGPALLCTAATAVGILVWRVRARYQVVHTLLGASLATACAVSAAFTGQAKSFFILPMVLPVAASVVCLLSVLTDRPLAGVVANRIVGGPPQWRAHRPLRRFYAVTTLFVAVVSLASLVAQIALYYFASIAWLGILHILMGPMWAGITAASVVLSRQAVIRYRTPADCAAQPKS
ncbi:DUF3159 domain-containing protein [Nocardia sp. CA-107356]|uniref:DUF3159 domain-containing protein n=1 Tax=Nocardia sp. CA-107356 TaxID=3239972 RepID=UPI003D89CE11